jgi:Gluconate 2-dehydrogenase subunit 3
MPRVSRRRFVDRTIRVALVAPLVQLRPLDAVAQSNRFGMAERRTLGAAADVIIPAEGRMPAATAAGVVRYIERVAGTDQRLAGLLLEGLGAIDAQAVATPGRRFDLAGADEQLAIIERIEKTDVPTGFFPALRDLVYEAYYTQSRIQKLLGYNFRSGRRRTAPLEPFDEERLARVRQMAPMYRQVRS